MKEWYQHPELEIVNLEGQIVTTSGLTGSDEDDGGEFNDL